MAKDLISAIGNIQAKALTLSGMKEAPQNPPEGLGQFPIAICFPDKVSWDRISSWKRGVHTIICELHYSRANLPKAVSDSSPVGELFADLLLGDPKLGNTVDTIVDPIIATYGFLPWGRSPEANIGWRFEITVKIQSSLANP